MKFILPFILLISLAMGNEFLPITRVYKLNSWQECPFLMFGYGVLSGSGLLAEIPDLGNCVANITVLRETIVKVVSLFEEKTVISIGQSVVLLGKTLSDLIDECGETYLEGRTVLNSLKEDLQNTSFLLERLQRLSNNIEVVMQDLDNMKYDYYIGNYYASGEDLGNLMKLFLYNEENIGGFKEIMPYPFIDCEENQAVKIDHVFIEENQKKNINITINGKVLRSFEIKSVKIEFVKEKKITGSSVFIMEEKKYQVGDKYQQNLKEIQSFLKGNYQIKLWIQTDEKNVNTCIAMNYKSK